VWIGPTDRRVPASPVRSTRWTPWPPDADSGAYLSNARQRPPVPRPKSAFDDLRPFEFRDPGEVLDPDRMYTVYEIARLLQGLDPDRELDAPTEDVLLSWAIPWMLDHETVFVFAEPAADDEPGFYGLATGDGDGSGDADDDGEPAGPEAASDG